MTKEQMLEIVEGLLDTAVLLIKEIYPDAEFINLYQLQSGSKTVLVRKEYETIMDATRLVGYDWEDYHK